MAEVTGQIGSEYVELNNAATEATLQELLKATAAMAKTSKIDSKDAQQEIDKLFKNSRKLSPELLRQAAQQKKNLAADKKRQEQLKRIQEAEEEYTDAKKRSQQTLTDFRQKVSQTINGLINFTSELAGMGDSISAATGIFRAVPFVGGALSAGLGAIAKAAESTHNALVQAASVGAGFSGSMSTMISRATEAGLTFDQFAGLISRNGEALAFFEGGVQAGANEFAKMGKLIKTEVTTGGLAALGITTEQANEHMLVYTRRLGRMGALQGKSAQDLVKSSKEYMVNLDALSKLTGKSRQELEAEQDRLMADSAVRLLTTRMAQIDDTAAQQFTNTLTAAGGLGTAIGDFVATGVARGPEGEFIATQMPRLFAAQEEARQEFLRTGVVSQATSKKLEEILQQESRAIMADEARSELLGAILKDNYGTIMQEVMTQAARGTTMAKAVEESNNVVADTASEAAEREAARQRIAELSNEINQQLANQLPLVTSALEGAADVIQNTLVPLLKAMNDNLPLVKNALYAVVGAAFAVKGALIARSIYRGARTLMGRPPVPTTVPPTQTGRTPPTQQGRTPGTLGRAAAGLGKAAAGVARFAGPIAIIAGAGFAIKGAADGVSKAAENFNLAEGEVATMGQKVASGFGGAIESLSFGLIDGGWVARGVHDVGESLGKGFSAVRDGITKLWNNPEETMKEVGDALHAGWTSAKNFVGGMWKGMEESALGQAISEGFNNAKDFISNSWESAKSKMEEWGAGLAEGYENAKARVSQYWTSARATISEWGNNISEGYDKLKERAQGLVTTVVAKAQDLAPRVQQALSDTADAAKNAVTSGWNRVTSFFSKSPAEVIEAVKDQPIVTTAEALPANVSTATATGATNQMSAERLLSSLNTKLDELIRITNMVHETNERQLTVQRSLSGDLQLAV